MRAPLVCIDCVEAAFTLPFDKGLQFERAQFEQCVISDEAAALRHVFFAERQAGKLDRSGEAAPAPVENVGIIGAGTMGSGIAIALLKAGFSVRLYDTALSSLQRGIARINQALDRDVEKHRIDAESRRRIGGRLSSVESLEALAGVELVIEAAFEDLAVKKSIFSKLASALPGVILATNTSYLDIDAISEAAGEKRTNVVGMHFFSPANLMRLLEVVRGKHTSQAALMTALAIGKRANKITVISGNCHGFIGNRLYACYQREAQFLIEEGALPEQVDAALTSFGFAMGPFAVADLAGLDISWANRKAMAATRDPDKRYAVVADQICERGWFGQKTGRGFYLYENGSRRGAVDPEITALIVKASQGLGIKRREISDAEIVQRCVFAIVNEGANVLAENIAERASDIDLAWLYGYGFPRWRGGPMHYASALGLETVLNQVQQFDREHDFWQPSPFLTKLVEEGGDFH
ncbi:MAG: 3-hydroxyacyl-CoA dehydrogenase [Acidiferrobacterales bacterium]|nr:3-hydroxyacyl-CoA dehydrogenase [Acidiferrobacterales bacterium]